MWDTSALIAGVDPFLIKEEQYTVPMVKEETVKESMVQVRFKMAIESRKLKVRMPEKKYTKEVKSSATHLGDSFYLSETDIQILALALQLKKEGKSPLVATDDYSIQNVADQLGIKFTSLATLGIRFRLRWLRYCPACYKRYPADYESNKCEVCGTQLKRKPSKRERINH